MAENDLIYTIYFKRVTQSSHCGAVVKDLVLPQLWHRSQLWLGSDSWPANSIWHGVAKKRGKKKASLLR